MWALDSNITQRLKISSLKSQLNICRLTCAFRSKELDAAATLEQKAAILPRLEQAVKECESLQYLLEVLERQQNLVSSQASPGAFAD
jgi:hypothetical protein